MGHLIVVFIIMVIIILALARACHAALIVRCMVSLDKIYLLLLLSLLVDAKSSHLLEYTSTCSESINVSSHVIKMMKHKHPNLGPGITHTIGSKQVHFRFDNERELDAAIDKFQEESNALEERLQVDRINVPQGVHKDEMFGLIVSQLEGIYKDTVITWIDGEIEIEIISTCLMEVKADLQRMMTERIPDEKVIEKNPTGTNNGGSWTSGLKKTFGGMFSSTPKIEYREKIELIFPNGRSLLLRHGNILDEHVDILVNPANAFLSHGAGLAKQIDKASNGAVGYYSKLVLPKIGGRLPTGGIVTTDAGNGNLHCSHVIHAVGPSTSDHTDQECIKLLRKTVHAILKEGFKLGCHSMAIPAISSGIFGMKKQDVAEVIIHILADHQQINQDHGYIMDIRVVVWDRETYEPFMIVAQQVENTLKRH